MMRNIIGQNRSSFDLAKIMDEKKIFLANLSKGQTGEVNSSLLGLILVSKMQMAAMKRARMKEEERKDFYLYIDEFQNFTTDSIATILSEARKYKLNLIMAHQYIQQLDEQIRDAVLGNVGSMGAFRIGAEDADFLEKQFEPGFSRFDLVNLDNFNLVIKMMLRNITSTPFKMEIYPPQKGIFLITVFSVLLCGAFFAEAEPITPVILSITPSAVYVGNPGIVLTVDGDNFGVGGESTVYFNGNAKTTYFQSTQQVTADIPASDLSVVGTYDVYVSNAANPNESPASVSNHVTFRVLNSPPPPPPPLPPNCNTGVSCAGSCSAQANTCYSGNGSQSNCMYTGYTGGGSCLNATAPNQPCPTNNCSSGLICSSGACIPPPGQITIAKYAVGGSGTFNFTGNIGITSLTVSSPSTTFSQTVSVPPGSNYNISEIVPAGWTQTSATCDNGTPSAITVVSNQNTTCLFTNTKSGSLTIVKNTTGGNDTFSFTVSGNGYSPIPLSFTTVGGTNTYIVDNIHPGSGYTITEADNPIWNLTSSSCTKSNGTSAGPISGFTIETGS